MDHLYSSAKLALLLPVVTSIILAGECRPGVTNSGCTITIKRENLITPLSVKLQLGAKVRIVVKKRPTASADFSTQFQAEEPVDLLAKILESFLPGINNTNRLPIECSERHNGETEQRHARESNA